jgi:hypothetical protein
MNAPTNIIDAMDDPALYAKWFPGETWDGWRAVLKAAHALPMTDADRAFFKIVAERDPPERPVKELWIIAGRRAGKDSIASLIAANSAAMFQDQERLRPGERALVLCLAVDRDQSKIVLNYTRSYFTDIDLLHGMVVNETANGVELSNGVDITIATNSFRSVRGRALLAVILDEVAFWRDDSSANPDQEVYGALRPGLASLPDSMLIAISSPYARNGLLYKKYREHYGKNSPDVLVIKAPTRALNVTIPQEIIDQAMAEDPAAAAAEWMAEFRVDVETFISREVVERATVNGRYELPYVEGERYVAFVDPSGGSSDSMTLGIAHSNRWTEKVILDLVREIRPPFSPEATVAEFSGLMSGYNISRVYGDRYAGEWPRERLRMHNIGYEVSPKTKNEIYRDLLPVLNSDGAELLDVPRLKSQLLGLERRTARGGRDSVDHAPGAHDDVINAAAGAILLAKSGGGRARVTAIGVDLRPSSNSVVDRWL